MYGGKKHLKSKQKKLKKNYFIQKWKYIQAA